VRLVKAGVKGNMDEINTLDNKVLRGKIKSAIVKEKRVKK
jgi:ABC-type transporter lipoprotein component MlaA